MDKTNNKKVRRALIILAGVIGIILFGLVMAMTSSRMVLQTTQDEMKENSSYIREAVSGNALRGEMVQEWSNRNHMSSINLIRYLRETKGTAYVESPEFLTEICSLIGAQDLMLVDRDGNVISSAMGIFTDLKDETYAPLLQTFETGKLEKVAVYSFSAENMDKREKDYKQYWDDQIQADGTAQSESDEVWGESYYGVSNMFPVFYASMIDEERACVINDYGESQLMYEAMTDVWTYVLKNEVIGTNGWAFAWSGDSGEILYYPDDSFTSHEISELGIDLKAIRDKEFVLTEVNGQLMYLYPEYYKDQDAWIVCAVPAKELESMWGGSMGILLWLMFGILAADLVYYAVMLLGKKDSGSGIIFIHSMKQIRRSNRRKKLLVFTIFCTVVIFLSSFYMQTLSLMSSWAENSSEMVDRIEKELTENDTFRKSFRRIYIENEERMLKLAGWYIDQSGENTAKEDLDLLGDILNLNGLRIMDADWNTTDASYSFSANNLYVSGEEGLTGSSGNNAGEAGSDPSANNTSDGSDSSISLSTEPDYLLVPLHDEKNKISGYIVADINTSDLGAVLDSKTLDGTMATIQPGEGAFVFAVNQNSRQFSWHPNRELIGKNVLNYGLKESDLQDNLCQFIRINKDECYIVSGQSGENLIYLAIRKEQLLRHRVPITATGTVAALVILLIIGLPLYTCPAEIDQETKKIKMGRDTGQSLEQKVFLNLLFSGAVLVGIFAFVRYFHPKLIQNSSLEFVMKGNWEYGLNVFALTNSLILAIKVGLGLFLFRRMISFMRGMFSVKVSTVLRMLRSLVTYACIFYIAYRSFVYFGMDPTTLMASAGIVSVVIGIGANSLVGDIIAGLFLLAEGNVQVGDLIRVDNFQGIVEEMGVRVTKIYDVDSEDIKIISNKDIQNVLHMSMYPANLYLEYQITYEENPERVENLLMEALKGLDKKVPEIYEEPVYLGIRRLDNNGVVLLVKVKCYEAYRPRVTRAVNRHVYMMFRQNGIEVPFPQITVHDASKE